MNGKYYNNFLLSPYTKLEQQNLIVIENSRLGTIGQKVKMNHSIVQYLKIYSSDSDEILVKREVTQTDFERFDLLKRRPQFFLCFFLFFPFSPSHSDQ